MNEFTYGDDIISNIEVNSYTDSDISGDPNIVASSMNDWELPNQIVTLEIG